MVRQFVLCLCSLSLLSLPPSPPLVMNFADAVQTTADEIRKMADDRRAGGRETEGEGDGCSPLRTCLVFDESAPFGPTHSLSALSRALPTTTSYSG